MSGPSETGLPMGWAKTTLGTLCNAPQYGWTTSASEKDNGVRLLRSTDISSGSVNWETVPFCEALPPSVEKYQLHSGDIVITRTGAGVGNSLLLEECPTSVFASYLIRFRPHTDVSGKYVAYFLKSPFYKSLVSLNSAGIAQPNVNAIKLASLELPLAPRREQDAIVAEIEKQFTRLDAAVDALKRVQANLKRYRAAVLKAACEGRLVPTEANLARGEGRSYEPASVLLERIFARRRLLWEASQQKKLSDAGKQPTDNMWKAKYKPPEPPDLTNLPQLPEGWNWASVESISTKVVDGVHKKPNYVPEGIPFVTVKNLTAGPGIDFDDLNHVTREDHLEFLRRADPEEGDLLITKDGTLGVVRKVRTKTEFSIFVSVAMIKPVLRQMADYLEIALSAPQVQIQMVPKGSGLQHIHLEDLRQDCVPVSPLHEQERITLEVARRVSVIDEIERELESELARAAKLRQSILKSAFEGKLILQDPNDEPAGILLERIRAERASEPKAATVRGRRKKETLHVS